MLRCLTLLVVVAAAAAAAADCPQYCECKWRGGKESAICRAGSRTQLLDLTGNTITALAKDSFSSAGLVNLQKVYLSRCRLATIDRNAFRLLINLVELDLTYNELQTVPSHAFEAIAELRELRLSGNPIQRIESNAFVKVPELVRLEMSDCKVSSVEARAFAGLEKSLEWLKLDHNRLSVLRPEAFADMQSLHGLELDGNPWNCTCSLRPFRNWMVVRNVPSTVPAVCALPGRLRGRAWDRLELDEFACGPRVEALRGLAQAVEGENVTLTCRVQGAPSPNVRWLFRNRVVANLTSPYASLPLGPLGPLGRKLLYVRTAGDSSNLTIVALDAQDAGVYVCVADNRAGKVDASVTLTVSRRTAPAEVPLSGKVVAASVLVALLFVLSTCLVALCLWSLRKRHALWVEQARGGVRRMRHDDANHYEKIEMMSQKPAVLLDPRVAFLQVSVPAVALRRGGGRRGRYRGVPTSCREDEDDEDVDEVGYDAEVEMTPTVSHIGGPWTSSARRSSDDTLSSHHSDAR
ncbi:hypothetical protein ONE63_008705 [Megalurothrips usitatus]|uniref:Ig-like domain-containing protein n=1 Tax=Megalurothrips usitatus TaxID=439358 RepID=A0AAV7XM05_9NEOP|nr:hypothetical protein ONE63_008705 [Megalurothrips usitatus]